MMLGIEVFYILNGTKISFSFNVTGWYLFDTEKEHTDEYDGIALSLMLTNISHENDRYNFYERRNNFYLNYDNPIKDYEYFISSNYWTIKDLTFATDLIMDFKYCGNQHNHPDNWFYDKEYIHKIFNERQKLDKLQEDFE